MAKKFQWTNDDQNAVARSIAVDKMSDEEAAKKWVDANADKVKAWLPAGTYLVSTSLDGAAISPVRVTVRAGVTRRVTFVLRLNAA